MQAKLAFYECLKSEWIPKLHALSPEKLTAADCEFQWRLAPFKHQDFWWRYRSLLHPPAQSARRLIRAYFAKGQPCFDRYPSVDDFAGMFSLEELADDNPSANHLRVRPQRGALTMARIHPRLGNTEQARAFAQLGLRQTSTHTALALQYESILKSA
jgi:hypothetical protein